MANGGFQSYGGGFNPLSGLQDYSGGGGGGGMPNVATPLVNITPQRGGGRGRGRPRKNNAEAKEAAAVASKVERARGKQRESKHKEKAKKQIERAQGQTAAMLQRVADEPLTDAAIEGAGILAESVAMRKAPKLQKYAGIGGVLVEVVALGAMRGAVSGKGRMSKERFFATRAAAQFGRGLRMRATIGVADDITAKIFAP